MGPPAVWVLDDFFSDPHVVRDDFLDLAFSSGYDAGRNFPGRFVRTRSRSDWQHARQVIEPRVGCPIRWVGATGEVRYSVAADRDRMRSGVHADPSTWSAVVYLTLPEHCRGGLTFYRHRETGLCRQLPRELLRRDTLDSQKWERVGHVPMRFNRLVVFEAGYLHGFFEELFGNSADDGRLTQHFYCNPEIRQR